jgi:hypothetical protein
MSEERTWRPPINAVNEEVGRIDWSEPKAENGYYPNGRTGCSWWVRTADTDVTDIVVQHLTLDDVPRSFQMPKSNPLPGVLTSEQWIEVKRRIHERNSTWAAEWIERAYKAAGTLTGKDPETAADALDSRKRYEDNQEATRTTGSTWRTLSTERVEAWIEAARLAARTFGAVAAELKAQKEAQESNVTELTRKED